MAIDLYSESSSVGISPRISFSHDFPQSDGVPIEQYIRSASPSSVDFDFCDLRESFDHESSSADEIFFDGKILPVEIKRKSIAPKKTEPTVPVASHSTNSEKTTEVLESEIQKSNSKSFWGFKRSSSLNCGSGYARTLCPIPLLSRSNSTGSTSTATTNGKRSTFVKENCPSRFKKSLSTTSIKQSSQPLSTTSIKQSSQPTEKSPTGQAYQKPPLKKSYGPYGGNCHSNGVKISPVINVPTPLIFGLGSIFSSSSRDNKSKKR